MQFYTNIIDVFTLIIMLALDQNENGQQDILTAISNIYSLESCSYFVELKAA